MDKIRIKEFPDIKVDIQKLGSKNPFYAASLDVAAVGGSLYLAYALAAGIQNTKRFLGTTIDVLADRARQANPEAKSISNDEFLKTLIDDFVKHGWVYGIVIDQSQPDKTERLLKTKKEIQEFLEGKDSWYDLEKVARTIFVPTKEYTKHTWGFTYEPRNLKRMIEFK